MQWWCAALGEQWTWAWRAYPGVWLFIIGVVALARGLTGAGLWAKATAGERRSLVIGVLSLWIALDWPLGPIAAGYLASAHAFQFLIITMISSPLILLGARPGIVRRFGGEYHGAAWLRAIAHPLVAAIIFNAIVAASHEPTLVDALMPSPGGAFIVDTAWFVGGIVFWWPVIVPVPHFARFGDPMKILYLIIGTLFHTVIGMVMLSAEHPLYGIYELAPPILPIPVRADQQLAGGVMELGVFLIIVIGCGILFFRWAARAEKAPA